MDRTLRMAWVLGKYVGIIGEDISTYKELGSEDATKAHFRSHHGPELILTKDAFEKFLEGARRRVRIRENEEKIEVLRRQLRADKKLERAEQIKEKPSELKPRVVRISKKLAEVA